MEAKRVKISMPEGCKATGVNTRIVDGAIVVEYYPERKYIPKDGDIVYAKILSDEWIFIFRGENGGGLISAYCALCLSRMILLPEFNMLADKRDIDYMRPAINKEKRGLFDMMEKEGYVWNEEEKRVEKNKWVPKEGEIYYHVTALGDVSDDKNDGMPIDRERIYFGNCFQTEEAAQKYAKKRKETFKNR